MDFTTVLCDQFHLQPWQVNNVIQLLDEGNTIPFIARYRKEAHGTLDDQVIRELSERLDYLRNLQKRKEEVGEAIAAQEAMTGELQAALDAAATLAEVEDIYRPYRPKRMTRATKAKERGLEPLAQRIYAQEKDSPYPIDMAAEFVNPEKEVETPEDALSGALDIIAEEISDELDMPVDKVREIMRVAQEPVSLETPIGEEEDSHLGDFIQDDNVPVPADAAAFTMLKEQLEDVLSTLTDREQKVLRLRFGLDDGRARTLEEVGKEFNVTRERIRQIEAKALRKLRHPSRSRKLKDYLD